MRGATPPLWLRPRAYRLFQSTRPRGARLVGQALLDLGEGVSIHAPTRGATVAGNRLLRPGACFNPRAHAGRDSSSLRFQSLNLFQSTRPRGARPASGSGVSSTIRPFQSTRPRGARRHALGDVGRRREVSIHAPTRGATYAACRTASSGSAFQSTRPRGARRISRPGASQHYRVSIHAPTRGATKHIRAAYNLKLVSIHAPTRGATFATRALAQVLQVSIHAPTRGATWMPSFLPPGAYMFQSTRPRGARRRTKTTCSPPPRFQSTRPRGARRYRSRSPRLRRIRFQSTRPRGARLGCRLVQRRVPLFQSTRPRGARRHGAGVRVPGLPCVSIHAPTRGATRAIVAILAECDSVSIHAPTRGATTNSSVRL